MAGFSFRARLAGGDPVFAAWISSNSARVAETVTRTGYDAALFDLQHGEAMLPDAAAGIAAVALAGKPSGVRVSLEGYAEAARCLDLGAEMVIMPMINHVGDAERLVDTLKYPPLGGRSWGPTRAVGLLDLDLAAYRAQANSNCLVLAMIETRPALDALDAILDLGGIDGVFVGPSDLSIALSNGGAVDPRVPSVIEAMRHIAEAASARGKVAGAYCNGGDVARETAALGMRLLAVGSDFGFLVDGARRALTLARGPGADSAPTY